MGSRLTRLAGMVLTATLMTGCQHSEQQPSPQMLYMYQVDTVPTGHGISLDIDIMDQLGRRVFNSDGSAAYPLHRTPITPYTYPIIYPPDLKITSTLHLNVQDGSTLICAVYTPHGELVDLHSSDTGQLTCSYTGGAS